MFLLGSAVSAHCQMLTWSPSAGFDLRTKMDLQTNGRILSWAASQDHRAQILVPYCSIAIALSKTCWSQAASSLLSSVIHICHLPAGTKRLHRIGARGTSKTIHALQGFGHKKRMLTQAVQQLTDFL